jgi:hypothetical protein
MKGAGGLQNGSWRVAWLCCPRGHAVGGIARRISRARPTPRALPRLYSSVAILVRRIRKPGESIWLWSERQPGEVDVLLGPPRRRTPEQEFMGASGRSLHFRKVQGRWTLVATGEWRT